MWIMGNPKGINEHHMDENLPEKNLQRQENLNHIKWHLIKMLRIVGGNISLSIFKDYYTFLISENSVQTGTSSFWRSQSFEWFNALVWSYERKLDSIDKNKVWELMELPKVKLSNVNGYSNLKPDMMEPLITTKQGWLSKDTLKSQVFIMKISICPWLNLIWSYAKWVLGRYFYETLKGEVYIEQPNGFAIKEKDDKM